MQFILIFESTLLAGLRVTTERFVNSDNSWISDARESGAFR
jgi:hypothetical protein